LKNRQVAARPIQNILPLRLGLMTKIGPAFAMLKECHIHFVDTQYAASALAILPVVGTQ